jgi:hypothetical protein
MAFAFALEYEQSAQAKAAYMDTRDRLESEQQVSLRGVQSETNRFGMRFDFPMILLRSFHPFFGPLLNACASCG